MESQKEIVLRELRKRRILSRRDIRALNINSETAVISELINTDGHDIRTIKCRSTNGKRFVKYFLIAPGVRRVF